MSLDYSKSSKHWLVCLCGNEPHINGFYACLEDGTMVEPDINGPWDGHLYLCMGCGAIYDAESFDQKGQIDAAALAAQAANF